MQKIRDYVVKGQEVFVGLEDAKRTWKLCVRCGRTVVHETSMPARYEVLQAYFRKRFPECRIRVMYEAGFRGFELHDRLVADGWQCVVTPPHTVTQAKCQRQKNDRIDCRRLAANNERGDYRVCAVPPRRLREDRQVARLSEQVQWDTNRVCNRIRRTLEFHGLDDHFAPGAWTPTIYDQVRRSLSRMVIAPSLRMVLEEMFEQLGQLRARRKRIRQQLRLLARSEQYAASVNLLITAPGIGWLTAIRLVLEWGDVRRFGTKGQFAAYQGLIPSDYSTGERDRKGHITKQGNRRVRQWLVECAWVAIRHDPVLLEKYRTVVAHTGSSKKAIVAVAHKLAIRLRAVLLSGQPYVVGLIEQTKAA